MLNTPSSLRGMTTSPHHLASQAGLEVLKDGGSAIEAGVAMAAAIAVVYPHMNSIGGDSFWLIREPDGSIKGIDACGAAAGLADLDFYKGDKVIPWRGPKAANTVAGTISGWQAVLEISGSKMPLERLLRDAVFYAENGVVVTKGGAEIARSKDAELSPQMGYADVYKPNGQLLTEGQILKQPALGKTLKRLIAKGLGDYYTGELARDIAYDLEAAGSSVRLSDLTAHRAKSVTPLTVGIKGAQLYNMTPPTQGLASLLILALFDRLGVKSVDDYAYVHGLVEATKQAFLIRDRHVGDPAYMEIDPQALLDDSAKLDALAARIDAGRALAWPQPPSAGDTVWFGAMDAQGRSVSVIQSTYFEFGSGIVLPQTGICWQNRGASFRLVETPSSSEAVGQAKNPWNALKPFRKPFHTLNPAMAVFDDGRVMSYGTMGGEGQPQTQAAVFSRYNAGVPLQAAITSPRWLLGRTWGEESVTLKLEHRFETNVVDALKAAGHEVEILPAFTATMGHAGALVHHPNGRFEGATDPRSDGSVAAW